MDGAHRDHHRSGRDVCRLPVLPGRATCIGWQAIAQYREWASRITGKLQRGSAGVGGAFRCESPEEVDRVFAELLGAGGTAHKEPWDAFWGHRYAQVKDPDGTVIDLFAPLPGRQSEG